ncbi:hypothetical protein CCYA_CCYA18G4566 [Cyanidiococcus yangmingshanensis]|nr:hypothetical protein CCYA_CCYA18G4566 [Cyanidiococcus yangmingshanensis]
MRKVWSLFRHISQRFKPKNTPFFKEKNDLGQTRRFHPELLAIVEEARQQGRGAKVSSPSEPRQNWKQQHASLFISSRTLATSFMKFPEFPRTASRGFSSVPKRERVHGTAGPKPDSSEIRQRNLNFLAWTLAAAVCTVGLSYASVPLYRIFCQVTGYGGTVQTGSGGSNGSWTSYTSTPENSDGLNSVDPSVDGKLHERRNRLERRERLRVRGDSKPINIRFNADVNAAMPITFVPRQSTVQVLPGEAALAFYTAQSQAKEDVVGIATYNVVPAKAGIYFNKIQCFCFEEQRFKAGEKIDMPVLFFIDREFYDDPRMVDVDTIILSYTFFRAQDVSPEFLAQQQRKAFGLALS